MIKDLNIDFPRASVATATAENTRFNRFKTTLIVIAEKINGASRRGEFEVEYIIEDEAMVEDITEILFNHEYHVSEIHKNGKNTLVIDWNR